MHKIDIDLKPSKVFIFLLCLCVGAALIVIIRLNAPLWLKIGLTFWSLWYGYSIMWVDGLLKSRHAILGFGAKEQGPWPFRFQSGTDDGYLQNDSLVTRWISVLRIKDAANSANHTCLIFYDSIPRNQYRELMMRLRCYNDDKRT